MGVGKIDPSDVDAVAGALADLVSPVVRAVSAGLERRRAAATAEERLTPAQRLTLTVIAERPSAITEIATATGVGPSSATRMVQTLQREALVTRDVDAAGDRRRRIVAITPRGLRVLEGARALQRQRLARLVEALPPASRRALLEGALVLAHALDAVEEPRPEV